MPAKLFIERRNASEFAEKKASAGYHVEGPDHISNWVGPRLYGPGDWVVWYAKPRKGKR